MTAEQCRGSGQPTLEQRSDAVLYPEEDRGQGRQQYREYPTGICPGCGKLGSTSVAGLMRRHVPRNPASELVTLIPPRGATYQTTDGRFIIWEQPKRIWRVRTLDARDDTFSPPGEFPSLKAARKELEQRIAFVLEVQRERVAS